MSTTTTASPTHIAHLTTGFNRSLFWTRSISVLFLGGAAWFAWASGWPTTIAVVLGGAFVFCAVTVAALPVMETRVRVANVERTNSGAVITLAEAWTERRGVFIIRKWDESSKWVGSPTDGWRCSFPYAPQDVGEELEVAVLMSPVTSKPATSGRFKTSHFGRRVFDRS